jgi:uncharacterized protein (DUF1800 family)
MQQPTCDAPPCVEPFDAARRAGAAASVSAASAALAACGGSSSGDTTPPPPPATGISTEQAARFLAQATFSASDAAIARVQALGYSAWLDEQASVAGSQTHVDWMVAKGYNAVSNVNSFAGADNTLWRKLIASPDPLRQRITLALSEIFVISMAGLPVAWRGFAVAAYVDLLAANCFANFRTLLENVTLSGGMGVYLNMRGNQKENAATGRQPDENYAREVLQLFSIGLYQLNTDGSLKLDAGGKPIETYDQATISGLAKVFTGWDFDGYSQTDPGFMSKPMVFNAAKFSGASKSFLGATIPGSTDGVAALRIALDTIFNHPNVGPFIGRQLIQRLVTSNPSAAYIGRVAAAFNNNGAGVRGDLKAVVKGVLLDAEARTDAPPAGADWGKVREPMQRFIQWARTFGASSPTDLWNVGDLSDPATRLGQSPLRSPSVFNFFRPGYVPPNTPIGAQGLVAPELQITNESTVVGYANFMQTVISSGRGEVVPDYSAELAIAADATALVDRCALLLAGAAIGATTKTAIASAVGSIAASTDAGKLNRVRAAIHLVMCSPEYLVQK